MTIPDAELRAMLRAKMRRRQWLEAIVVLGAAIIVGVVIAWVIQRYK